MTENEIKEALLQVCKVKGWDSDINIVGFHALCDKLKELGAAEKQADIDSLHALYEQACKQRDEVMDWQRAMIANMRGQMQ